MMTKKMASRKNMVQVLPVTDGCMGLTATLLNHLDMSLYRFSKKTFYDLSYLCELLQIAEQ